MWEPQATESTQRKTPKNSVPPPWISASPLVGLLIGPSCGSLGVGFLKLFAQFTHGFEFALKAISQRDGIVHMQQVLEGFTLRFTKPFMS